VTVAAGQVFPTGDLPPAVAAFCEPMSIAVRALERGRVGKGDTVVTLGAGPVGQAVTIGALDRGARVLVTDLAAARLALAAAAGADVLDVGPPDSDAVAAAREWSGGEGPDVVVDCTGAPSAIADGVAMVAPAGRVVVVGISQHRVGLPVNVFTEKEIDLLGSTVCTASDFAEAIRLVGRHREQVRRLVTHEVPLVEAPSAVAHAMRHPGEVLKLVVRIGGV
jgi:L-gulonate 5-dehydrogenase